MLLQAERVPSSTDPSPASCALVFDADKIIAHNNTNNSAWPATDVSQPHPPSLPLPVHVDPFTDATPTLDADALLKLTISFLTIASYIAISLLPPSSNVSIVIRSSSEAVGSTTCESMKDELDTSVDSLLKTGSTHATLGELVSSVAHFVYYVPQ